MHSELYDAGEHAPCAAIPFDPSAAQHFIERTIAAADEAFHPATFWPLHPEDRYGEHDPPAVGVYNGAAGTIWALTRLAARYGVTLRSDYASALAKIEGELRDTGAVPSYSMGTGGVAFVRYALFGDEEALQRCMADARANSDNPTREFLWGAPGTSIPALLLHERGDRRFDAELAHVQDVLWSQWDTATELWTQDMYGQERRFVGAGHGAAGNVAVFLRAPDLLPVDRREQLFARIESLLERYALFDGSARNWWSLALPEFGNRLQWCHGAPGIVMSLRSLPRNERIDAMLAQAGAAIERAGPLKKGPGICHGTAGNGFALLYLAARTGDERWLDAARRFAAHAIEQTPRWVRESGMHSASLMTGETGVALFIDAVLRNDAALLSIDTM